MPLPRMGQVPQQTNLWVNQMRCIFTGAVRLLIAVLLSSQPASTFAQDAENTKNFTSYRGAQYYLGDEDELLMKVNIWGFVRKPGQYMIPPNTDLISLMSFAGGPIEQAKIKSIKIVRSKNTTAVFVYNEWSHQRTCDEKWLRFFDKWCQ